MTAPATTVDDDAIRAASRRNRDALSQLRDAFANTAQAAKELRADITETERDE